jgi:RHS repeat-associated protein
LYFTASTNRLTGWSYDNAGNLLNDGVHTYAYNGENKIRSIDSQSAYIYDGEGQRVRKLLGENLRFIYGIQGVLIAEFDGTSGALKKEYIYGANGLTATIEPTAINSNGTRYATSDHLGSPRVITNSSAGVVSRHDYMPFGDELGAGVGGRTSGMGFGVSDGLRQKFTSYERDIESSLDYAGARFYSNNQGRFTSIDPLMESAVTANPQTFNRYSYVTNSPLTLVDPTGMFGICPGGGQGGQGGMPLGSFSLSEQRTEQQTQTQQKQPPVYDVTKDKTIAARVAQINKDAKPLAQGQEPVLTRVEVIVGDTVDISGQVVQDQYGQQTAQPYEAGSIVRPVAYVPLDQSGNIMTRPTSRISVQEVIQRDGGAPKRIPENALAPASRNGVFYDMQLLAGGEPSSSVKQVVRVVHLSPASAIKAVFKTGVNDIKLTPGSQGKAGSVDVKIGPTVKE